MDLQMKRYIGIRTVNACPMTRKDATPHLCYNIDYTTETDGYLLEHESGDQVWFPADTFNV